MSTETIKEFVDRSAVELSNSSSKSSNIEFVQASNMIPEPIAWLWDGWLAMGKMHILGGAPGTGKTTISLALAASITVGGEWPDGSRCKLGNVVIWSGEDDPQDTLIPRLIQAGANLSQVYFVTGTYDGGTKRSFDPAVDMNLLKSTLEKIGNVRLVIIDPIVSAITGDSHKNSEVRRGLQPLVDLAASMGFALLGITHFSKGTSGREPIERIAGSLAFGALARIVLVAAKQQKEEDNDVRLLLRAKSNIGFDSGGFEYELKTGELDAYPGIFASSVLWGKNIVGSARELLTAAESNIDASKDTALVEGISFLAELLSKGALPVQIIKREASNAGHSWPTIQRAKRVLRVESKKEGGNFGEEQQKWLWQLVEQDHPEA